MGTIMNPYDRMYVCANMQTGHVSPCAIEVLTSDDRVSICVDVVHRWTISVKGMTANETIDLLCAKLQAAKTTDETTEKQGD